jgi:penicillin-binding protein 1A
MGKVKEKKKDLSKKKNVKTVSTKTGNFSKFKNKWKKGSVFEKILTVFMVLIVLVFGCGMAFMLYIVISAPDFNVENLYTSEASIVYDANNNEIARLGTENRERVTYDDLPEVFIDALIATEDSRFFQHKGVDMARFLKASIGQLLGQSGAGGASTLTMQIAKQRYNGNESSGIKGIIRKFTDMYMSVFKLEKNYTKEQLIEYYVNIPELGNGSFGIEQASQTYFGKSISEVTLSEAALLAGLFQAPTAYNPYNSVEKAEKRRDQVLYLMKRHGYITDTEYEAAKKISVKSLLSENKTNYNEYQGFINTVISEVEKRTGKNPYYVSMKIYSTMIPEKQQIINDIYDNNKNIKWVNENIQAAIAVTDVESGAIVAIGTGRKKGLRIFNYATDIKKHPGSTAKPIFDYGPAIEYLNWSTGQTIVDEPYTYSNGSSIKNWDNRYDGVMTIKTALASSRNIPALQTFQALTQNQIKTFVTGLGITPDYDENGYINESHSMGGFDGVSPLQLSAAYGAFARGGVYIEPYSVTKIEFIESGDTYTVTPEKRVVMEDSTAYMINMILKYAVTAGYISPGTKSGTDICAKTGTSTVDGNFKKSLGITESIIGDAWQVTYSPDYVMSVWVGYPEITAETYLTKSVGNTLKKSITKELTKGILEPNSKFTQPASVVTATIELETTPLTLASEYTPENLKSVEYFKKGTVPDEVSTRFSQLENPTNLKAVYNIGSVELTWDAIKTPDAIDDNYLTTYFEEGYKTFAEKYLARRKQYNSSYIGTNGYHVYIKNASGNYTDLGFTTNNKFTYTGSISGTTTFMVKSSYSIFKANMSTGVSVAVSPTNDIEPVPSTNWTIELNGDSEITVKEYYALLNSGKEPLKITDNGSDVTKKAQINSTCWKNDKEVDCETLDCNESYTIQHTAFYNNKSKTIKRQLKAGC